MRARHPGFSLFSPWGLRICREGIIPHPGLDKMKGIGVKYYTLTEWTIIGFLRITLKGGGSFSKSRTKPGVIIKETRKKGVSRK